MRHSLRAKYRGGDCVTFGFFCIVEKSPKVGDVHPLEQSGVIGGVDDIFHISKFSASRDAVDF